MFEIKLFQTQCFIQLAILLLACSRTILCIAGENLNFREISINDGLEKINMNNEILRRQSYVNETLDNLLNDLKILEELIENISEEAKVLKLSHSKLFPNVSNIINNTKRIISYKKNLKLLELDNSVKYRNCSKSLNDKVKAIARDIEKKMEEALYRHIDDFEFGLKEIMKKKNNIENGLKNDLQIELENCNMDITKCKITNEYTKTVQDEIKYLETSSINPVDDLFKNSVIREIHEKIELLSPFECFNH